MTLVQAQIGVDHRDIDENRLAAEIESTIRSVVGSDRISVRIDPSDQPQTVSQSQETTPEARVRAFLGAMEARDIDGATSMLADDFAMNFPGTGQMSRISELLDWAKDRYRFVKKTITSTEAFHNHGCAVVYVIGTLSGEWSNGEPFEGIRFIDRFEIKGGKIVSQDVWNDIAEERAK